MDNMKIKDQIKKMLHRLGQIEVLPASVINSVKIVENHDPMVDLKDEADFPERKTIASRMKNTAVRPPKTS